MLYKVISFLVERPKLVWKLRRLYKSRSLSELQFELEGICIGQEFNVAYLTRPEMLRLVNALHLDLYLSQERTIT